MNNLKTNNLYTRKDIWKELFPNKPSPTSGDWFTGYTIKESYFIAFVDIDTPGRTEHKFLNSYDMDKKELVWYGKPNSHSQQDSFKKFLHQDYQVLFFARWDNEASLFVFLGTPRIKSYSDFVDIEDGINAIKFTLDFNLEKLIDDNGPDTDLQESVEGNKKLVLVNKYERNHRLRIECIKYHGVTCKICNFNFEKVYGDIGKNFCHIHHIKPLGEVKSEHQVNPKTDLIPLCPNCHSMIHRYGPPALLPEELKKKLKR